MNWDQLESVLKELIVSVETNHKNIDSLIEVIEQMRGELRAVQSIVADLKRKQAHG